ncbi:unnamed protein product, partial [Schistosoma mattheei]
MFSTNLLFIFCYQCYRFVQKFKPNRSELAEKLYQIYNEKIFSNQ